MTEPIRYILFPGRHHLVTRFQAEHLRELLDKYPGASVVWAITSADHGGTRRNPIPGFRRLGLIEAVTAVESLPTLTFLITNQVPKPNFAHYVIEEIRTQTGGRVSLTPSNTIVACSTPAVIADYQQLGFQIDPVELNREVQRPWDIVERIIARGDQWSSDPEVSALMHPQARDYYARYGLAQTICQIYADPLIDSEDGDITVTRDYATYRAAFEENAQRKVGDFAEAVRPGRIMDVGAATGQTIKILAQRAELFESDFYGIEVARPLYEICQQRKSNGEFGEANVYFYQRNIMQTELFAPDSLDTVITMALTHEVESYLGRAALVEFIQRTYAMLKPGGVYINYDVVGPAAGDEPVLVRFTTTDGLNPSGNPNFAHQASPDQLRSLSSRARFLQFARDFRATEGDGIKYSLVEYDGVEFVQLKRSALYEFLAKKDYCDSWYSEMHERFCFFDHTQWKDLLEEAGFVCTERSRAIRNPWLIENRFAPAAQVFTQVFTQISGLAEAGALVPDKWSATNTLLVAEKPR